MAFTPSVAPWFSGILSILSAPLSRKVTSKEIRELYEEMYKGEKLITVGKKVPELGNVSGIQGWTVGGFQVHSEGERVVIVVSHIFHGLFTVYCACALVERMDIDGFFVCREDWITCLRAQPRNASRCVLPNHLNDVTAYFFILFRI